MPVDASQLPSIVTRIVSGTADADIHSQATDLLKQNPELVIAEALKQKPSGYAADSSRRVRDITTIDSRTRTEAEPPDYNATWHDCIRRRSFQPLVYYKPETLTELVGIIKKATDDHLRVKSVGSGHSFSDVTDGPDYLVDTHALCRPLSIDPNSLRNPGALSELFRVQAGILISDLNEALDEAGVAMLNLGGYTGQTIAGAISTGTHGSGMELGPLADFVASLQLVTTDGKVYQIEPSDGITDPTKFSSSEEGLPIELIQDDDWFYAAVVSMGCFGVIYSLVLHVRRRYWLLETRAIVSWSQIKEEIKNPDLMRSYRHFEVVINPHTWQGNRTCLVTRRVLLDSPPQTPIPGAKNRNPLIELLASVQGDGSALLFLMRLFPQAIPCLLDQCILALRDEDYVGPSYKIFDLGPINDVRAYGIEVGVPFEQAVAAAERMFEVAEQGVKSQGQYTTGPFALRFVHSSKALLAPMFDRLTCMVEMICMYDAVTGSDEVLRRHENALLNFTGRPHWGLSLNSITSLQQVRALYPNSIDHWLAIYRTLNSKGTFNNAFTDRIGISI